MTDIRALPLGRIWRMAVGFPGAHAFNAALNILFTLVQTLVLARVLAPEPFSQTIAATTVGLYFLPVNQAVARANFVLLRERAVRGGMDAQGAPEAAAAFQASQALLLFVSLIAPWPLGAHNGTLYWTLAAYVFSTVFSNIWYSELQMIMLATDHAMQFETISLLRRIANCGALIWLWYARDFFAYSLTVAGQALFFHVFLLGTVERKSALFSTNGLSIGAVKAHLGRLWTSLQATFAEWLTLNAPYAIFTARFGVGPGLVAMDAFLKLLRLVVSVTRNLCEIALQRVSHAVFTGRPEGARLPAAAALAGGGLVGSLLALALILFERRVFDLLLGPNNVVPTGAGWPAAIAVLSGAGFATGSHLVGHTGRASSIRWIMAAAAIGAGGFAAALFSLHLDVLRGLWAFALSFAFIAIAALQVLLHLLNVEWWRKPSAGYLSRGKARRGHS